jgi:uncharacterized protein (TIGR02145 family)
MKTKRGNITTACVISVLLGILSTATLFGQDSMMTQPAATEFKIVTIGTQEWMSENLNVDTFRNGEPIPEAKTKAEWEAAYKNEAAAWCYYNNDPANGNKFGRLYNWYAVNDPRGLAPAGWHIPSDDEWTVLVRHLGGDNVAGPKMKSATGWSGGGNGNNSSGFNGLPGGERLYEDAVFYQNGIIGFWWSSTKADKWNAWYRALHASYALAGRDNGGMNTGFSVRCIKDSQADLKKAESDINKTATSPSARVGSKQVGITFSVPNGIELYSADNPGPLRSQISAETPYFLVNPDFRDENVNIKIADGVTASDLDEMKRMLDVNPNTPLPGYKRIGVRFIQTGKDGNLRAVEHEFQMRGNVMGRMRSITFVIGKRSFIVTCGTAVDRFEKANKDFFELFLNSIEPAN